jgi:hypothetical protein
MTGTRKHSPREGATPQAQEKPRPKKKAAKPPASTIDYLSFISTAKEIQSACTHTTHTLVRSLCCCRERRVRCVKTACVHA